MGINKLDDVSPEYWGKIETAALKTVVEGIRDDPYLALKYLMSTRPEKFHPVIDTDGLCDMLEEAGLEVRLKEIATTTEEAD